MKKNYLIIKSTILVIILILGVTLTETLAQRGRYNYGIWNSGFRLRDPGADQIVMWDDSANLMKFVDSSTPFTNYFVADDGWIGLGSGAGRIVFDDQATDEVNIMNANVGIGTAEPDKLLHIQRSSAGNVTAETNAVLVLESSAVTSLNLLSGSSSNSGILWGDSEDNNIGSITYNHDGDKMRFFVNAADRMNIDSSGNVSIGTPDPADRIDITGGGLQIQEQANDFAVINTTQIGIIKFFGDDDTASADEIAGQIEVIATGTWTDGAEDAKMVLNAANNGTLNANQLVLNTDGFVGIGKTPDNELHVSATSTARIEVETTAGGSSAGLLLLNTEGSGEITQNDTLLNFSQSGSADMVIDSTGKIGIGTVGPDAQLDITKAAANATQMISSFHDTEATTPLLTMRKADNTEASPALVDDNAVLGTIHFDGHDGTGWHTGAKIEARIDGTPSDGTDMPAELTFWTTPEASATIAQRMTIDDAGSIGIGITGPSSKLDVVGDIEIGSADNFFYGDPSTDNTWKTVRSGTKLSFQRRETGAYVEKGFFDTASFHSDSIYVGNVELTDLNGKLQANGLSVGANADLWQKVGTELSTQTSGDDVKVSGTLLTDTINESTTDAGVTINSELFVSSDYNEVAMFESSDKITMVRIQQDDATSYSALGFGTNNALNAGYLINYGSTHPAQPSELSLKNNFGDLTFYTGLESTGGGVETVRIDSDGNIAVSGTVDGIDIGIDVPANTTHRTSNGSDHTYIDQDVTSGSSPIFETQDAGDNSTKVATTAYVDDVALKGVVWTSQNSASDLSWYDVAYGNGMFVAVAGSGTNNRVMTSPDGVNWTSRVSAADNDWDGITYGNGLFVAVAWSGTGNRVMTSPGGITWTSRTSASDLSWTDVTYGNGLFVAVADSGSSDRVMTSPNGIDWKLGTSASSNDFTAITYGNGLFVAVAWTGAGNRVMTSPDGFAWTSRTEAALYDWCDVTYGNGLFVVVAKTGGTNRVMTSPNGINWTLRTTSAYPWVSVTYGDGVFVAVAETNKIMTSPDGITWTTHTSPSENKWMAITYGNGLFVTVADSGTGERVMTSGKAEMNVIPTNNIQQGGFEIRGDLNVTGTSYLEDVTIEADNITVNNIFSRDGNISILPDGSGNVGIGIATPDADAILELNSTTKGFLPPRMTATQRDAITTPPAGLMVHDTTNNKPDYFNGTIWKAFVSTDISTFAVGSVPFATGAHHISDDNANLFWDSTSKRLGIGINPPTETLHVNGRARVDRIIFDRGGMQDSYIQRGSAGVAKGISFYTIDTERMIIREGGNVGIGTSTPTSKLQVVGLPVYANNAAAITGGLTVGAFYRTGGDPDQVCVVH